MFVTARKTTNNWGKSRIFAVFLAVLGLLNLTGAVLPATSVYAEPNTSETTTETEETEEAEEEAETTATPAVTGASCEDSLGALGWWVCPNTGKIAEAADWLYDKIEGILVINPVEMTDGSPIYEIWKYFRGVTNIIFIIFLLVMVYSQLTGVGITNYGLKKTLPKLIVGAVLVNLSFIICSLAVDVSNIIGNSLRGVFSSISEAAFSGMAVDGSLHLSLHDMYGALAGGSVLAIAGGAIAFETGAIWMLIPVVLGAIVAIASGLITIAMRQAVVALLIMIAPLAIVAYILPNTDQWFKKWRQLLMKMLVFYPMFSLLFGASQLAGFAIIASSSDGFGVLLGTAVQIFPLFFSWSLMKMSGTFLSSVNARISAMAARPLATNRSWAESRREATRMKYLASNNTYLPSLRLRQYLSDRKIHREEETKENAELVKNRGLAYGVNRHYKDFDKGILNAEGETAYADQARNMRYQRTVQRHKNNMNEGYGAYLKPGTAQHARVSALDTANVNASDFLKAETARGEMIDYRNAAGYHQRMEDAINAHFDAEHAGETRYKQHNILDRDAATARYGELRNIMNNNVQDVHYTAAAAAHAYDTQVKIVQTKMQKYFELTPPTKDVEYRLQELTSNVDAVKNIDEIISGLRILNQRGDTDLVRKYLQQTLDLKRTEDGEIVGGVQLGTHASQAIASFLMFDVKDNDPFLRRFGKYINLETAKAYNENERQNTRVSMKEYVTGQYEEDDPERPGEKITRYAKRPMKVLMEGTSLDNIERTAMKDLDDILKYTYTDDNGNLSVRDYIRKREEIQTAIGPQFISASLKYLSGSEQLKSAVSFLTGYTYEQSKDDEGKVRVDENGDPIYEWKARWEGPKGDLAGDAEFAREYFQRKTKQYFEDQTPIQIYGLRSDYRDPVMKHFLDRYLEDPEHSEEYSRELSEIQARYADEDAETAMKKRTADKKALDMKMAGNELRHILDTKGKLEQVYRMRRNGVANNTKDFVRDWLMLDDETAIYDYLDRKKQERDGGKSQGQPESNSSGDDSILRPPVIYDQAFRVGLETTINDIFDKTRDQEDSVFFEQSYAEIVEELGEQSLIATLYKKYRENEGRHADRQTMWEFLTHMIENPDSY